MKVFFSFNYVVLECRQVYLWSFLGEINGQTSVYIAIYSMQHGFEPVCTVQLGQQLDQGQICN